MRLPGLHDQVRQQRLGLLAGQEHRGSATHPELEASEEAQVNQWLHRR
jgi:hypothetical protein